MTRPSASVIRAIRSPVVAVCSSWSTMPGTERRIIDSSQRRSRLVDGVDRRRVQVGGDLLAALPRGADDRVDRGWWARRRPSTACLLRSPFASGAGRYPPSSPRLRRRPGRHGECTALRPSVRICTVCGRWRPTFLQPRGGDAPRWRRPSDAALPPEPRNLGVGAGPPARLPPRPRRFTPAGLSAVGTGCRRDRHSPRRSRRDRKVASGDPARSGNLA